MLRKYLFAWTCGGHNTLFFPISGDEMLERRSDIYLFQLA
jgi:hypothetical protein